MSLKVMIFTRTAMKIRGLRENNHYPSALKTITTEVQSPLYTMALMKAPYDGDVGGGRGAPQVIFVSSAMHSSSCQ